MMSCPARVYGGGTCGSEKSVSAAQLDSDGVVLHDIDLCRWEHNSGAVP